MKIVKARDLVESLTWLSRGILSWGVPNKKALPCLFDNVPMKQGRAGALANNHVSNRVITCRPNENDSH